MEWEYGLTFIIGFIFGGGAFAALTYFRHKSAVEPKKQYAEEPELPVMQEVQLSLPCYDSSYKANVKHVDRMALMRRASIRMSDAPSPKSETVYPKRLVLAMCGLPARGKSAISHSLIRYLRFLGCRAEIFNVGNHRRKMGMAGVNAEFFKRKDVRMKLALEVQEVMYTWLYKEQEDRVAIFDATNTTIDRRSKLIERAVGTDVKLVFIESICDDAEQLELNIKSKVQNDDYKEMDPEQALADFRKRIKAYEKVYQTVEDSEGDGKVSYVKTYNVGEKVTSRYCHGFLSSHISFYLANTHINKRRIWLCPQAESVHVAAGLMGLDSRRLSEEGERYREKFTSFFENQVHMLSEDPSFSKVASQIHIFLGTSKNSLSTAKFLSDDPKFIFHFEPELNELNAGDFGALTRSELNENFPDIVQSRQSDKLHFRYPGKGGESYMDLIVRLRSVIIEMERQRHSICIIGGTAVRRCLYGYFQSLQLNEIPWLSNLDAHTIFQLTLGRTKAQRETIEC